MAQSPASAVIVGRSLVTSLAHDVVTSCAAARAGVTRPSQFTPYPVSSPVDPKGEGVTVHAVASLTQGFEGRMRLARLMEGALRDLQEQCPEAPWTDAKVGVFLSLPDPRRLLTGASLLGDEPSQKALEERARNTKTQPAHVVGLDLLRTALQLASWKADLALLGCAESGTTGTTEMIGQALAALHAGTIELALILAADSFLDVRTLGWLDQTARLKIPARPAGCQPGEAAGCLLLESPRRARARKAQLLGIVDAPAIQRESDFLLENRPSRGLVLARVVAQQGGAAAFDAGRRPWLISDLDGDVYRAMEWGNAWMELSAQAPACRDVCMWTPAEFFGATGAASGVVAICLALSAFARSYAPWHTAVIVNASDGPVRASVSVHAPPD